MEDCRRTWLVWLAAGSIMPSALIREAAAQKGRRRVIDVRIEHGKVVAPKKAIRITEGEEVELRFKSDESVELHLHGYDLKIRVRPNEPAAMVVKAHATGRFPLTSHGRSGGGHGHDALIYLEIYPR